MVHTIQHHRPDDDDAHDHLLVIGRYIEQIQAIADDADEQRPNQGARHGAGAAGGAGAANDGCGNGIEFKALPGVGLPGRDAGCQQDTR